MNPATLEYQGKRTLQKNDPSLSPQNSCDNSSDINSATPLLLLSLSLSSRFPPFLEYSSSLSSPGPLLLAFPTSAPGNPVARKAPQPFLRACSLRHRLVASSTGLPRGPGHRATERRPLLRGPVRRPPPPPACGLRAGRSRAPLAAGRVSGGQPGCCAPRHPPRRPTASLPVGDSQPLTKDSAESGPRLPHVAAERLCTPGVPYSPGRKLLRTGLRSPTPATQCSFLSSRLHRGPEGPPYAVVSLPFVSQNASASLRTSCRQ